MLAGIPHEPAGITATLAFRYNPEFPLCFFNAGSLPPIAAAAVFFCIRSRANEPDALSRAFAGTKKP
jgi:hypothetical protein